MCVHNLIHQSLGTCPFIGGLFDSVKWAGVATYVQFKDRFIRAQRDYICPKCQNGRQEVVGLGFESALTVEGKYVVVVVLCAINEQ